MLVSLEAIGEAEGEDTALQHLVARELADGGAEHGTNRRGQPAPVVAVADAEMAFVPAEQLVGSLADERHLHVLARALADEVHGDDRGRGDRLFQTLDDVGQGALELGAVELDRNVAGAENQRRLGGVRELVVFEAVPISHGVGRPRAALFVHQG